MSRKPNTNRWLGHRGNRYANPQKIDFPTRAPEVVEASHELSCLMGLTKYYYWTKEHKVSQLSDLEYLSLIKTTLAELQ